MTEIKEMTATDLLNARAHSYYTIIGAGGDLNEWMDGYNKLLGDTDIGNVPLFYRTNGALVNQTFNIKDEEEMFPNDLTFLMFPLDNLHIGKLAIFKLRMGDRWFDDVIDNIERRTKERAKIEEEED